MSGAALADRFLFRWGSQKPPPAFALQELPREEQWEANNERLRRVPARISERFPVRRPWGSRAGQRLTAHRLAATSKGADLTASPALLHNRDKTELKEACP